MIAKVMAECDRLKASSVAFPALGTGNLAFPSHVTAKIMVQAAHRYLQENPNTSVKKVLFIIYHDEVLNAFQRELSAQTSAPAMSSGSAGELPMQATLPSPAVSQKRALVKATLLHHQVAVKKGALIDAKVSFNLSYVLCALLLCRGYSIYQEKFHNFV